MRKIKYKKGRKVIPSILEYTGVHKETKTEMQFFIYDSENIEECFQFSVDEIPSIINNFQSNWLNIHGLNDIDVIKKVGQLFDIDQFILSDILNINRRTKLEEYNDFLFFNIKSILPIENTDLIHIEQISFILKHDVLISFQEKRSDFFTHIRERLRTNAGIVRTKKVDYLLYLLLDAIIENFFITIEKEELKIEELLLLSKIQNEPKVLEKIEHHRDNFYFLKRSVIPLRDSLHSIMNIKDDEVFHGISRENFSFFARLHQKCLELLDQIDNDMLSLDTASNFYFSTQNQKLNQVMKTLTIISSLFIPLTFIVGVYGMNFEFMPELKEPNGYFIVWGVMIIITILMIIYFKVKKWF